MFEVMNLEGLFSAFKDLGNGRADAKATRELLARAEGGSKFVLQSLFREVLAEARRSAEELKDPLEVILALAKIAGYSKDLDDFAMAIALLPKIHNRCAKARAKKAIAVAYVKAGKFKEARDFARSIKSHYWRAEARVAIAEITRSFDDLAAAEEDLVFIHTEVRDEVGAQLRALKRKMGVREIVAR